MYRYCKYCINGYKSGILQYISRKHVEQWYVPIEYKRLNLAMLGHHTKDGLHVLKFKMVNNVLNVISLESVLHIHMYLVMHTQKICANKTTTQRT